MGVRSKTTLKCPANDEAVRVVRTDPDGYSDPDGYY
jgi:hypothetical protein